MKVEIKVPAMGESITEATVGEILKASGSQVKMDEEIIELETDKVNQVLYAPEGGVLQLSVNVDDTVTIGQVIGHVDTAAAGKEAAPAKKKKEEEAAPAPKTVPAKAAVAAEPAPAKAPAGKVRAGKDAFVADVLEGKKEQAPAPAAAGKLAAAAPAAVPGREGRETRRRMSKIRRVIAERLVEAQHTTAMLTTFNEIDMSSVIRLRSQYKDKFLKQHGVKLGFMSFFVKVCVSALQAIPYLNSYIDGDEIVHREYYDIGIAVGTQRGLVVPVVRNCDTLSFAGVEEGINTLAKQAREGKLALDDLRGGGFTITNGGVYGSLLSTPILNPPQSGILGMHKIEKRAVVVGNEIVIRPMMYVALSYDHRIVDGQGAVTFLVHVKEALEEPSRLLIGV